MKIEFFHDVLCAWCYAFSPRLRQLVNEFPQVEIIHRCFALAPTPESIAEMFGSKSAGKAEILKHWEAANQNDDEHRICTEEMACKNFDYPYSMPGLIACKAAEFQGGQQAHWDMFDRIQKAHLTEILDISDSEVLLNCAKDVGLNIERFLSDLNSEETKSEVKKDIDRATELGVYAVPSLVFNGESIFSGAYNYENLRLRIIQEIKEA